MPYRKEVFRKSWYYHIYNRGFQRQQLFFSFYDYQRFLDKLSIELDKCFILHAFVLMPNHFHLLLEQNTERSISELLRDVQVSYAKYYCLKYKKRGSVFESRFKAKRIDSKEYLLKLVQYIHQNPLVAGLTGKLEDWRWSSYWSYIGEVSESCVTADKLIAIYKQVYPEGDFKRFNNEVNVDPDEDDILIDSPRIIQSRDS
jgi:REP element-mobilizing transposase RayT